MVREMTYEDLLRTRPMAMSLRHLCSEQIDELVANYVMAVDALRFSYDEGLPGLMASNYNVVLKQWKHIIKVAGITIA